MTLLREGVPAQDDWILIDGDSPLPAGPAIVPADRFAESRAAAPDAPLGAHGAAEGAEAEGLMAAAAAGAAIIVVTFPAYNDGRFFSLARRLRQAGFTGTLRASGPLIPDQAWFAERVGFDEIEIPEHVAARAGLEAYVKARRAPAGRYQWGFAGECAEAPVSILAARHAERLRNAG